MSIKWGHMDVGGQRQYFAEAPGVGVYTVDRDSAHDRWELWFLPEGGDPKDLEMLNEAWSYKESKERAEKHASGYTPNAGSLGTIGDVNPIEYGGGIVFAPKEEGYSPTLEVTYGLDDDSVNVIEDDEGSTKLKLYRVDIADDASTDLSWVDWEGVARSIGSTESQLLKEARSKDLMARVYAYESAAGYYGWQTFDSRPLDITARELDGRWFDGDDYGHGPRPVRISYAVYNVFQRYWHGQGDSLYAVLSRRGNSVDWVTVEASENEIDRLEETANEIIDSDESTAGDRRTAESLLKQLEKLEN